VATPDVPIAKWVGHPRSYTSGRRSGQPSVIVLHTTDGHEGPNDAENGAAYDKSRTDGTSTHYFVDSNSIVQEVEHKDESHAALPKGNDIGIHIEICGVAAQSAAQWADDVSRATLENVAKLIVQIRKTGNYPLKRLSSSELRSAWNGGQVHGICGHVDITHAFPEDNGTHTDPGSHFPWSELFARVREIEGGDDLPVDQSTFSNLLRQGLKDVSHVDPIATLMVRTDADANRTDPAILDLVTKLTATVGTLTSKVDELTTIVKGQTTK